MDPERQERGKNLAEFNSYARFIHNLTNLEGRERNEFAFEIYRALVKANPTAASTIVPPLIDRVMFNNYLITIKTMDGGFMDSTNLPTFFFKIFRAVESAIDERYLRNRTQNKATKKTES
jgi:hypothetical protein